MKGDKDLLALMGLVFGETVVHKWHLIKPQYRPAYTFSKIVIEGETRRKTSYLLLRNLPQQ
jgi:hypothetical protein